MFIDKSLFLRWSEGSSLGRKEGRRAGFITSPRSLGPVEHRCPEHAGPNRNGKQGPVSQVDSTQVKLFRLKLDSI